MIAALLHGRTHLNFQEFRQQSHLTFFLHVLGVLELLQPHVFQSEHQGALWDCLLSFIRLLLVRGPDAPLWWGPSRDGRSAGTQDLRALTLPCLSRAPPSNRDWWVLPLSTRGCGLRTDTGPGPREAPGTLA